MKSTLLAVIAVLTFANSQAAEGTTDEGSISSRVSEAALILDIARNSLSHLGPEFADGKTERYSAALELGMTIGEILREATGEDRERAALLAEVITRMLSSAEAGTLKHEFSDEEHAQNLERLEEFL